MRKKLLYDKNFEDLLEFKPDTTAQASKEFPSVIRQVSGPGLLMRQDSRTDYLSFSSKILQPADGAVSEPEKTG